MVNPAPPNEFEFNTRKEPIDHYRDHLESLTKNKLSQKGEGIDLDQIREIAKA